MRIDWSQQSNLTDDEQRLLRLMRGARVFAAALLIGGIVAVAVTSGPFNSEPELARTSAPASGTVDRNLMTLESGVPG